MSVKVPTEMKEQIKIKNDIVDVINEYTTLTRAGNLYTGRCPLSHGGTNQKPQFEKNSSLIVYPNTGTFFCFGSGCRMGSKDNGGAGSDVIAFIQEMEDLGYIEACKFLAHRAGIHFSDLSGPLSESRRKTEKTTADNRNYYHNLWVNHPGVAATIAIKRGIDMLWLKTNARMGLVPSDHPWELIRDRLAIGIPEMTKLGNPMTIAIAYRKYNNTIGPDWVNDPTSDTFQKSHTLYMYPYAYKAIRKRGRAIIMEGYFDVLSAHYHGLTNTVGIMGSAFTEFQMDILRKETDELIIWPDADAAGWTIVENSLIELLKKGFKVRVILMDRQGIDPDEFFKEKHQPDTDWNKWVQANTDCALSHIINDFRLEKKTESDIVNALDRLIPFLQAIQVPGEKAYFIDSAAKRFKVDPCVLVKYV